MKRPTKINQHLAKPGRLDGIVQHAKQLMALEEKILALLPDDMRSQCRLLNIRDGKVIIGVKSAAYLSKLRFQLPELEPTINHLLSTNKKTEIELKIYFD